jgi:hypothetical protein
MKQSSEEHSVDKDRQLVGLPQVVMNRRSWLNIVSSVAGALVLPESASSLASFVTDDLSRLPFAELEKKLDAVIALNPDNLWSSICYNVRNYPFTAELNRIHADDTYQSADGMIRNSFDFCDQPRLKDGIDVLEELDPQSLTQGVVSFVNSNWHQRMPENIKKILALGEVASKNLATHHAMLRPIFEEYERRVDEYWQSGGNTEYVAFGAYHDDHYRQFRLEQLHCNATQMRQAVEQLRRYAEHVADGTISEFVKDMPPEQQSAVQELLPKEYIPSPGEEIRLKRQSRDSLEKLLIEYRAKITRHATAEMLLYRIKNVDFDNLSSWWTDAEDAQKIPDPRIGQLAKKIDPESRYTQYSSGVYEAVCDKDSYKFAFPPDYQYPHLAANSIIEPQILIIEPDGMLIELLERLITPEELENGG